MQNWSLPIKTKLFPSGHHLIDWMRNVASHGASTDTQPCGLHMYNLLLFVHKAKRHWCGSQDTPSIIKIRFTNSQRVIRLFYRLHLMAIVWMRTKLNLNLLMSQSQMMLGIESLRVIINRLSQLNSMLLMPIFGFGLSKSGFMAAICKLPLKISSKMRIYLKRTFLSN